MTTAPAFETPEHNTGPADQFHKYLQDVVAEHERVTCALRSEIQRLSGLIHDHKLESSDDVNVGENGAFACGPTQSGNSSHRPWGSQISSTSSAKKQHSVADSVTASKYVAEVNLSQIPELPRKGFYSTSAVEILGPFIPDSWNERLTDLLSWWHGLEEPRSGNSRASVMFRILSFLVIVINAMFIVYTSNQDMSHALQGNSSSRQVAWEDVCEIAFTAFYTIELLTNLVLHRRWFFIGENCNWNMLDLILVILGLVDLRTHVSSQRQSPDVSNFDYLRVLRIIKVAKVCRVMRAVKFVRELRVMLDCVVQSSLHLCWCMIMIIMILYVFALVFVQALAIYANDHGNRIDRTAKGNIESKFGTVWVAMVSLFQATTGGVDWITDYNLVSRAGFDHVYLVFIAFFVISAWNIVTCTFVEKAMHLALPNIEDFILDRHEHDAQCAEELMRLLQERFDEDGNGFVSVAEFDKHITDTEVANFLRARGMDLKDAKSFFKMLQVCHGVDGGVDLKAFVGCALRLQGHATSIDLQTLHFDIKMMHERIVKKLHKVDRLCNVVEARFRDRAPRDEACTNWIQVTRADCIQAI